MNQTSPEPPADRLNYTFLHEEPEIEAARDEEQEHLVILVFAQRRARQRGANQSSALAHLCPTHTLSRKK